MVIVFYLIVFLVSPIVFARPQVSTYALSQLDREVYCAKVVDGYFHEGDLGEKAWSAFTWGQDKYNPFIWIMTGDSDRYPQVKRMMTWHPGGFRRCILTSSLPVLDVNDQCADKLQQLSETDPSGDLKSRFCFSKNKKFLSEGSDVPASIISAFSKKSIIDSNNISKVPAWGTVDFALEINQAAEMLWNKLLSCYSQNAEGARLAFIENKPQCPELKSDITIFKANVYNSFMQTEPKEYIYVDNRLQYNYFRSNTAIGGINIPIEDEEMQKVLVYERNNKSKDMSVHPLISQVALQILINMYLNDRSSALFNRNAKATKLSNNYKQLFKNSLNVLLTVNNNSCIPMGLYPNAGWAAWSLMRERLLFALERQKPIFTRELEHNDSLGRRSLKMYQELFFKALNSHYGVVTSNCLQGNLPPEYFNQSQDILKEFNIADSETFNLNPLGDKK